MSQSTISSNTLFHFTEFEKLKSILKNGFRPQYCLEDLNGIYFDYNDPELEHAFPMVCFCDIPLSQIRDHLKYGYYGIGLKKEWGMQNKITPVLYAYEKSAIAMSIFKLIVKGWELSKKTENHEELENIIFYSEYLRSFTKPYQGRLWRRDKYVEQIRFYDEREWRFVPWQDPYKHGISKKEFFEPIIEKYQKQLWENIVLKFNPSDIKYIIVSREDEIVGMIEEIEKNMNNSNDKKLLYSKIISTENILDDF
jgi:hypothetical protein